MSVCVRAHVSTPYSPNVGHRGGSAKDPAKRQEGSGAGSRGSSGCDAKGGEETAADEVGLADQRQGHEGELEADDDL